MISVINPSQYGAFPRASGHVQYPEFYPAVSYQMAERQSSALNMTQQSSASRVTCQYSSSDSVASTSSYFSTSGTSSRLSSSPSSGCVQPSPSTSSLAPPPRGLVQSNPGKDYSKPLFVDCSIEYELPNAPKIPKNSQPILMIHPTYQKKLIAQQQQIQQRSSPCTGPQCRQCHESALIRKKFKESGDMSTNSERKATKRTYSVAIETTENIYKHSIQGMQPQSRALSSRKGLGTSTSVTSTTQVDQLQYLTTSESPSAKRSRLILDQQLQEQQHRMNQLISQHQQQQHAAVVAHHAAQQARAAAVAAAVQAAQHRQHQQHQQQLWPTAAAYHLSSFQQITPPGLQAFWPTGSACRSACCCCSPFQPHPPPYGSTVTSTSPCSCCCTYPGSLMLGPPPPTPLLSSVSGGASAFAASKPVCIGCVQGTCRVGWNKENVGRLRSLWTIRWRDEEETPKKCSLFLWWTLSEEDHQHQNQEKKINYIYIRVFMSHYIYTKSIFSSIFLEMRRIKIRSTLLLVFFLFS